MGRACSEHSARRNTSRILEGKPEGNRPLIRPSCRWNGNIKMDSGEDGVVWAGLFWLRIWTSGPCSQKPATFP
jgi:hypothetical protein